MREIDWQDESRVARRCRRYRRRSVKHFRDNRICSLFIHFRRQYRVSVISPFLPRRKAFYLRFPRGNQGTIDPLVQQSRGDYAVYRASSERRVKEGRKRKEAGKRVGREKERDFQLQGLSVPEFHSKPHCSREPSCGQDFDPSTESNRFAGNFS